MPSLPYSRIPVVEGPWSYEDHYVASGTPSCDPPLPLLLHHRRSADLPRVAGGNSHWSLARQRNGPATGALGNRLRPMVAAVHRAPDALERRAPVLGPADVRSARDDCRAAVQRGVCHLPGGRSGG